MNTSIPADRACSSRSTVYKSTQFIEHLNSSSAPW
jgi:hypothetical protein